MNIFVEGLQGSGKSTMVQRLSEANKAYSPVMEGEYSPVELAWCAYVDAETYRGILQKYPTIRSRIEEKTYAEGDKRIICYTKIKTDVPGLYRDLEQYEIYNGRRPFSEFRSIVLNRYQCWQDEKKIYECALLQNTVEDMILYRQASDDEILRFYEQACAALRGKEFRIIYLETEDIPASIETVKRERIDEQGNERWFSLVCEYFNASPYAKANGLKDFTGFVTHLQHRQALELTVCREYFSKETVFLKSKKVEPFLSRWETSE